MPVKATMKSLLHKLFTVIYKILPVKRQKLKVYLNMVIMYNYTTCVPLGLKDTMIYDWERFVTYTFHWLLYEFSMKG